MKFLIISTVLVLLISGSNGRSCRCRNKDFIDEDPVLPKMNDIHVPRDPEGENKVTKTPVPDVVPIGPELVVELEPEVVVTPDEIKDDHTRLNVVNSCSFPIALGFTGSDKNTEIVNGKCIGKNLIPNEKGTRCFFHLEGMPKTIESDKSWSIELDSVTPDDDHIISGNVWASRVDQMESHCPMGTCPPWVGPRAGLTKAEFTFSTTKTDYYDISNIEAISIPTSMYPLGVTQDLSDYYENGSPGKGVCEWNFEVPGDLEKYMTWVVDPTGQSCESKKDCPTGEVCGVTFSTSPPTPGMCGTLNGIASAHLLCISGLKEGPFECDRYGDAISCMGEYSRHSGYTPGLTQGTTVAGCPDWESMGINAPPKFPCVVSDEMWTEQSLPFLKVTKNVCPNGYVFCFDDSTSLYTSKTAKEYVIEFCPDDSESKFFGS